MFHAHNLQLVKLMAKAMEIPLVTATSSGIKEKELSDLKEALMKAKRKFKVQGVVSGAIQSKYQKERVEAICKKLKLKSIAPLWHCDEEAYLKELISSGFEVMIIAVAAQGLDESWLGRKSDLQAIEDLKTLRERYRTSLVFEGGEAETLCLRGPMFHGKRIEIEKSRINMENECTGAMEVLKARLVEG